MRYDSVVDMIGNTPLVRISPDIHGLRNIDVWAKLEMHNPFGSIKDRTALAMIRADIEAIKTDGKTVVELSSGNTAKALAALSSIHGVPFKTVTNRMKVPEVKEQLLLLGAEIEELPGQAECLDPSNSDDPLSQIHRMIARDSNYFHTDQYFNPLNTEAHLHGTGEEIVADLGFAPDFFVTGVGTAGSSTGIATSLRKHNPDLEVLGVIAEKADFIPGIRNIDEVGEVGLFDPTNYDELMAVSSGSAIDSMMQLVRRSGILSGPTGGASFHALLERLRREDANLSERKSAVFVVCDRFENYASYIRKRRPDLLTERPREFDIARMSSEAISAAPCIGIEVAPEWIDHHSPLIIDLRGSVAYRTLHIRGAMNIVDSAFADMLDGGLPFESDRPLLLTCPVGEQSRRFAALLQEMGHKMAFSLDAGIVGWRDSGHPMVRGTTRRTVA